MTLLPLSPAPIHTDLPEPLPTDPGTHVAVVVDDEHDGILLYLNGVVVAQQEFTFSLSDLDEVNNWLGRSQCINDHGFGGAYDEFRIDDKALSGQEIAESFAAGPDL